MFVVVVVVETVQFPKDCIIRIVQWYNKCYRLSYPQSFLTYPHSYPQFVHNYQNNHRKLCNSNKVTKKTCKKLHKRLFCTCPQGQGHTPYMLAHTQEGRNLDCYSFVAIDLLISWFGRMSERGYLNSHCKKVIHQTLRTCTSRLYMVQSLTKV